MFHAGTPALRHEPGGYRSPLQARLMASGSARLTQLVFQGTASNVSYTFAGPFLFPARFPPVMSLIENALLITALVAACLLWYLLDEVFKSGP